jgi:N-acyl amino acid synthase of PEP-CTERM/exosortase system
MYRPDFLNLKLGFSKYFTAVPALTEALKRAAYSIRHDVYCRDLSYEGLRADGMETDAYDAQSLHCLLKNNVDGEYVGCIRLVLTRPDDHGLPLPFELICSTTIDRTIADPSKLPRETIAEVSRLAVLSRYRRRKGEADQPGGIGETDFGTPVQPRFPYIPVGLYLGMLAQAQRQGIETLFVLTEPRLAKNLSRLGIKLQCIGSPVEHRGLRVPSRIHVSRVIKGFGPFLRPLFEFIDSEIHVPAT